MMKYYFLLTATMIFNGIIASENYIGVQSGFNFSSYTYRDDFFNERLKFGFVGGFKYEILLSGKYSLSTNFIFSRQGYIGSYQSYLKPEKYYYYQHLDYLSLPIKFGYAFGNTLKFIPRIGFQTSYLVNAKYSESIEKGGEIDKTYSNTDGFTKIDLASVMEAELDYKLKSNLSICTSIYWKYSFNSIAPDKYEQRLKLRNNLIGISIGVKYKI